MHSSPSEDTSRAVDRATNFPSKTHQVLWIDENYHSKYNKIIVDFMKERKIKHILCHSVKEAVEYFYNEKEQRNQSFLVICTNSNCSHVSEFLSGNKRITQIIIFCGTIDYGRNNVKKLGGKFTDAFTKSDEIMKYIEKISNQQRDIAKIRGKSKHLMEKEKQQQKEENKEKNQTKECHKQQIQSLKKLEKMEKKEKQQELGDMGSMVNASNKYGEKQFAKNEKQVKSGQNSYINDVEVQKKQGLHQNTYQYIGETYKLIGGEENHKTGEMILKMLSNHHE